MAAFPCPYCGHALVADDDDDVTLERCPSCDGSLMIAYRYRLVAHRGAISGGELYEASDDGFDEKVAILFVAEPDDDAAVERFLAGNRLFAELGGRGLVKIHEVGSRSDRRAYVVFDWLAHGTLDRVVNQRGALGQATLLELVSDLLTGLSKAHRAMPAIVHGHIHPGKIGFVRDDEAALFGFEWARQVSAQRSRLADAFVGERPEDTVDRASDLRQLGISFHYAATGEWLGEQPLAAQRSRARAELPGPLGRLVDRMLGAGLDGYESAVEAAIDFEQLMRGQDRWQARAPGVQDRSREQMGTAWATPSSEPSQSSAITDDDIDELFAGFEELPPQPPQSPFSSPPQQRSQPSFPAARPPVTPVTTPTPATANHGKVIGLVVAGIAVFGTCVASLVADVSDDFEAPPPAPQVYIPPPQIEPVVIPEPPPAIEVPANQPGQVAGIHRYVGAVTGPPGAAGLEIGSNCEIWVEPNDGGLNCRWYVDCGQPARRIYGGADVGYSTCTVEDGHPIEAEDADDDAPDGAFVANFGGEQPMLFVEDRWTLPPVRVMITIVEGGPDSGPIPAVPLAPRLERTAIQERIDRGDYPVIEDGVIGDWGH